jgi:hypothetical protein
MSAIQIVGGLVLLALIIAIPPAHGESLPRSTDRTSASKAYQPVSDGLYPETDDVDELMHGDARNIAKATQAGPYMTSKYSDVPARAKVLTLAVEVFHTPRSRTGHIPHRVLNSTNPIYMTAPIALEPEVEIPL